jgi:hypothetical protein
MSVDYPKVIDHLTDVIKELNVPCGAAAPAERSLSEETRRADAVGLLKALLSELEQESEGPPSGAAAAAAEHGAGAAGLGNFIRWLWEGTARLAVPHDTYVFVTVYDKRGRPAKSAKFTARSDNVGNFAGSLHDSFRDSARVDKVTEFINVARAELGSAAGYVPPNAPLTWENNVYPLLSYNFLPRGSKGHENVVAYQFGFSEQHNRLVLHRGVFGSVRELEHFQWQKHHDRANGIV